MKSMRNTNSYDFIDKLIPLLERGFQLDDALNMIVTMYKNATVLKLIELIKKGNSIEHSMKEVMTDHLFLEIFLSLYPIKGLTLALKDANDLIKRKEQWKHLIKKQMTYPLLLVLFMGLFSLFTKTFLLPEMQKLYLNFGTSMQIKYYLLIEVIPLLLIGFVFLFTSVSFFVIHVVKSHKKDTLHLLLHIPFIAYLIRTYYSLKFAFYFTKISTYFDNFYEAMHYFYTSNQSTDLCLVLENIYYKLQNGIELQTIINECVYFTKEFQQYFYFVSFSNQTYSSLEHYCDLTFENIREKLKVITNIMMSIIYGCTGLYVMMIYQLMIIPILELTSTL